MEEKLKKEVRTGLTMLIIIVNIYNVMHTVCQTHTYSFICIIPLILSTCYPNFIDEKSEANI